MVIKQTTGLLEAVLPKTESKTVINQSHDHRTLQMQPGYQVSKARSHDGRGGDCQNFIYGS